MPLNRQELHQLLLADFHQQKSLGMPAERHLAMSLLEQLYLLALELLFTQFYWLQFRCSLKLDLNFIHWR